MMVSLQDLNIMSETSIDKVKLDDLIDIETVKADCEQPISQRIESYIGQIENPYCFRCGDTPIRIRFVKEDSLSNKLVDYFTSLKSR